MPAVRDIINVLEVYAKKHGDQALVAISDYQGVSRAEPILRNDQIATTLTTKGEEEEY